MAKKDLIVSKGWGKKRLHNVEFGLLHKEKIEKVEIRLAAP